MMNDHENDNSQEELKDDAPPDTEDSGAGAEKNADKNIDQNSEDTVQPTSEEFAAIQDRLLRTMAEYDNFRKRNAQAVSNAYRDGAAEAVLKLLPVADTFGYAYDAAADDKAREGIDKVIKNFKTILSSLGVEEIEVNIGDTFDENIASAVMNFPCEDGEEPNTVKQVLKKGYKQGDKVIRFAQVAVTI